MSRVGDKKRKTRSDKKRDVKPSIPIELYDCVNRISYITSTPMKDIGVYLCKRGISSSQVIEEMSKFFKRTYSLDNTMFIGDFENERYVSQKNIDKKRLTLRFSQKEYERINNLSFALDLTVSSTTGLLLEKSIKNDLFVKDYIQKTSDFTTINCNENKKRQLKEVFKYVYKNNPYTTTTNFTDIVKFIYQEVKEYAIRVAHYK